MYTFQYLYDKCVILNALTNIFKHVVILFLLKKQVYNSNEYKIIEYQFLSTVII